MPLLATSTRAALALALIAAAPLPHLPAHADPIITEKITTYAVSGKTPKDVRADINRKRKAAAGGGYDSINNWNTWWTVNTERTARGCAITSVKVTLDIEIVIPKLVASAPADLRRRFDTYLEHLMVHERGHSKHSIAAARQIEPALMKMAPKPTCRETIQAANKLANSFLLKQRQIDKDYDARTRHGATQGATFP
jgi:predicted secreted Zn-dependent protease